MIRNELAPTISLDGAWDFALGSDAAWGEIQVPGCWEAQGYSKWVDGPARYRRSVYVPAAWAGSRIELAFDAVSYACTVHLNGVKLGDHRGLWTPFQYDVTETLRPGADNLLELELYKPGDRYPMRETLAGFLPDVATTFGGLWQSVRLRAFNAGFHQLQITPEFAASQLRIQGELFCLAASAAPLAVAIEVTLAGAPVTSGTLALDAAGRFTATLPIPDLHPWSPHTPALYSATLCLQQAETTLATYRERFGFRSLVADGERLLLNGEPIQLRGLLSWGWEPARIAPTYTVEQARALIRSVASLGFNLLKLCLFVPNQTLYDIADEEGILLWQEWPLWLPEMTPELRARAPGEYAEYVQLTQHHPSVVIHSIGCELADAVDAALLQRLDVIVRGAATGALVCDNSGSSEAYGGAAIDLADFADYHTYGDLQFLEPMLDHWRRDWQRPRPLIFGEFCDSDGFRDLDEIVEANDGTTPWWMTADIPTHTWRAEVRGLLEAKARLAHAAPDRTYAELAAIAAAQSYMVRKYTLETVRRRAAVQGYVITGLRDTPIATSGVFDDLGHPKSPSTAWLPINGDCVLSLDVDRRRAWQYGGDRPASLDLHNWWAGAPVRVHLILNQVATPELTAGQITWQLHAADGALHAAGEMPLHAPVPAGRPVAIGVVEFTAPSLHSAQAFRLSVGLHAAGIACTNAWPLWFYPRPETTAADTFLYDPSGMLADALAPSPYPTLPPGAAIPPGAVLLTGVLDAAVLAAVTGGGAALLLQCGAGPPVRRLPFWREALKLIEPHPIWAHFPHTGHVDLQFWGLATDTAFDITRLAAHLPAGTEVMPILRRLDAREFEVTDYVFEARLGQGRLIACALRLHGGLGSQPSGLERNVAGRHLLTLLIDHLRRPTP